MLSYLDRAIPRPGTHSLGLFPDAWMSEKTSVLFETPEAHGHGGRALHSRQRPRPAYPAAGRRPDGRRRDVSGSWTLQALHALPDFYPYGHVTIAVDKTFNAPGERRNLAVVITDRVPLVAVRDILLIGERRRTAWLLTLLLSMAGCFGVPGCQCRHSRGLVFGCLARQISW